MAKKKTQSAFFCQSCGTQSPKWLGKCSQCNEWNTFVEEIITKNNDPNGSFKSTKIIPCSFGIASIYVGTK